MFIIVPYNFIMNKNILVKTIFSAAFKFHFMALVIDVIDRHGPSSKMRCHLQPKVNYGSAVLSMYITAKDVLPALHY